jgi:hypothetical protein
MSYLLALVLFAGCGGSKICTVIGCSSGASLTATLPGSFNRLSDSLEVCRNRACATLTVEASGSVAPSASPFIYGSVDASQLTLFYEAVDYHDSDVYDVTVVDAQNARVAILHGSGQYLPVYPNGKDCDQVPVCRQAAISAM